MLHWDYNHIPRCLDLWFSGIFSLNRLVVVPIFHIQVQFCRQVSYVWIFYIFKAYKLWFNTFESTFFNLCANKVLLHHWHYQLSCWAICGVDVTVFCPRTKAAPSWYALNWKVLYEWKTNNLISPNNHWKRSNDIFDQKGYHHRYLDDNIPLS